MKLKSLPTLVIVISLIFFSPSLFNFFSSDDWFHLRVSQISSFTEFLNFFLIKNSAQSTLFYRPLSTQTFYFLFQTIFGLQPFFFHVFFLAIFGLILTQIYSLALTLTNSKRIALLSLTVYAFSVTNLPRLYFLSGSQEVFLGLFTLLTLNAYLKSKTSILTFFWFVLALLSKETAIFIPVYLLLIDWLIYKKYSLKRLLPFFLTSLAYVFLVREKLFTNVVGDATYIFNYTPKAILNTLMWYVLWALGAPELLVDYIGSGFRPIPRFFSHFGPLSFFILILLFALIISLLITIIKNRKKLSPRLLLLALCIFVVSLGPLLLLPQHKFTLEMAVPLIGFSLGMGVILNFKTRLVFIVLSLYLTLNLSMYALLYGRHYTITRALISQNVFSFLSINYPKYPVGQNFEFINDTPDYGQEWGSSLQVAHAINISELFRVFYSDPSINVFYQDLESSTPSGTIIKLNTSQFLP